jgi:hypothetical protein
MKTELYKNQVQEKVAASMLDYLSEDEECGYSKKDVQKCEKLLSEYLDKLNRLEKPTDKTIMEQVKKTVLALNKLNKKTDYCLIETDAREEIWQIIQNAAIECGLSSPSDDITEQWREW